MNAPFSARISVIELFLLDALLFPNERLAPAFFQLFDDLLVLARVEQIGPGAIERDAALRHDANLRDDAPVEKLQVSIDRLQLARLQLTVPFAQHRGVSAELFIEARPFPLRFVERAATDGDDQLFLVLDPFAVVEHGLQGEGEALHVTLISLAIVCSNELVS
ncbi:MAG TPA: hypothetical protein VMF11_14305 [Candidatus Baltobacteraceae bacterium]|nr:hypothetical protein [Candidatus Baltobacteraceae bacterium]